MSGRLKGTAKFVIGMFALTILCAITWQALLPGKVYDCSDDNMMGYLRPGDWVHHPVVVQHIVPARTMSEPDTIKAGWSVTLLWCLWVLCFAGSLVVSTVLVKVHWLPRKGIILSIDN